MKNFFSETTFLKGVIKYSSLPHDEGYEFLLAGRSNAGKSSALNSLTSNSKLARTSKMPGRTQEIILFQVNEEIKLLDLPGYGFSKSGKQKQKDWNKFLQEYFECRRSLCAVIIFMDIRHPLKTLDMQLIDLCECYQIPFIVVLTKIDKLAKHKQKQTLDFVEMAVNDCPIVTISSTKNLGFEKLREIILKYADE